MIDRDRYQKEKDALSQLVTVGAFRAWLEGLEKLADDVGVKTGIRRWIDRVGKMEPAQSWSLYEPRWATFTRLGSTF